MLIYKIKVYNNNYFLLLMYKYLPPKALKLISEYSKPLTRPDWRFIERMPNMGYIYNDIIKNKNMLPVYIFLINKILNNYNINSIILIVKTYGMYNTSKFLNIPIDILNNIILY